MGAETDDNGAARPAAELAFGAASVPELGGAYGYRQAAGCLQLRGCIRWDKRNDGSGAGLPEAVGLCEVIGG